MLSPLASQSLPNLFPISSQSLPNYFGEKPGGAGDGTSPVLSPEKMKYTFIVNDPNAQIVLPKRKNQEQE
jgi:hypothetical protein